MIFFVIAGLELRLTVPPRADSELQKVVAV
jgi:hypothetical protein